MPSFVFPPSEVFTTRLLPDTHVLVAQYEMCQDSAELSTFIAGFDYYLAQNRVDKLVIDLRRNGGGASRVLRPFIDAVARSSLNAKGRLFVAIGRQTFSSAIINAIELRQETKAQLVGEPTGGSPNSYGQTISLPLPYFGLSLRYTTRFFALGPPSATTVTPDVVAPTTSQDLLDGVDPVLTAISSEGA